MALNMKPSAPQSKVESKVETKVAEPGNDLKTILAAIKKTKGDHVAVTGSTIPPVQRLPTGLFELDYYLGGGFPKGRFSIVYGPESSCKTNVCLRAIVTAQHLPAPCNKAIYVDLEHSFDKAWAEKMGVDIDALTVIQPGYGEEAVDIIDAVVRGEDVAVVVVDSLAALIANKEKEQSTEKYDIGTSALLIKRLSNKLMVAFADSQRREHHPCVLFINQTRFKPGVMFGDPETMPGGEAVKFLSSLRIRFNGKNIIEKASNTVVFKDIHATIKKAKVSVRAASFDFTMCMAPAEGLQVGDTDSFNMVKGHLQALGLLTNEKPKGYKVHFDSKPQMFGKLTEIQDLYVADLAFRMKMQALVLAHTEEKFVFVSEPSGPTEVPPGDVTPVQSVAGD